MGVTFKNVGLTEELAASSGHIAWIVENIRL